MSFFDLFRIDDLKAQIDSLERKNRRLEKDIAEKDKTIMDLKLKIESCDFHQLRESIQKNNSKTTVSSTQNEKAIAQQLLREQIDSVARYAAVVEEQFEYEVYDFGVEITRYIGTDTTVIVPKTIQNKEVWRIYNKAFYHCDNLEKVILPPTLESIGEKAFAESGIKEIELPEKLEEIEEGAFWGTEQLKSIIIPGNVTQISKNAFFASGLETLVIKDGCETIEESAFGLCPLKQIILPKTLKTIEKDNFRDANFQQLILPESLCKLYWGNIPVCYSSHIAFLNNEMDVKSAFLYAGDKATVYCNLGSNAHIEARENGIPFKPLSAFPTDIDRVKKQAAVPEKQNNETDTTSNLRRFIEHSDLDASTWNPESILRQEGYTVSQKEGLSDYTRQQILKKAIAQNKITKWQAIEHIELQIGLRRGNRMYNLAISKWERDVEFLKTL